MERLTDEDNLFYSPIATYNTLLVCLGNTCRSVMLHAILNERDKTNHVIFSAGVIAKDETISQNVKKVLTEEGMSLPKTKPQRLSDLDSNVCYDRVILLDEAIREDNLRGLSYRKVINFHVEDPEYEDLETFRELFRFFKNTDF